MTVSVLVGVSVADLVEVLVTVRVGVLVGTEPGQAMSVLLNPSPAVRLAALKSVSLPFVPSHKGAIPHSPITHSLPPPQGTPISSVQTVI